MIPPCGLVMLPRAHDNECLSVMNAALSLRLLGEPRVFTEDGRQHRLERRDAALLAVLAMQGPQSRAGLAELLWPDAGTAKALTNLRQRLFRLRRDVGRPLVVETGLLGLDPAVLHDLRVDAIGAGDGAESFDLLGSHPFAEGDLLAERIQTLRAQWRQHCADALARVADQAEAQGNLDQALKHAQRLLLLQPLSEHAHRRCMRLHYLRGDRALALVAFQACCDRLQTELGALPDEDTRRLFRLIESSALPVAARASSGADLALTRPPRLAGRQAQWRAMASAWGPAARVVLRGEAGMGKTRLATEFVQAQGPFTVLKAAVSERGAPFSLLSRLLTRVAQQLPAAPNWATGELAHLVPAWGVPVSPRLEPLRLRQALEAVLAPWLGAGLGTLLLDDVQWADDASLQALLAWLHTAGASAPPVLLCVRAQQQPAALVDWLGAAGPGGVLELDIGPLDSAGLGELLASLQLPSLPESALTTAVDTLMRQTGGHPFFLLELLRSVPDAWMRKASLAADGDAYGRLIRLLQGRVGQLPEAARQLARLASLAGASFSAELAAHVLGRPEMELVDPWRTLTEAMLLQPDGQLFDLVQDAVLADMPTALRRPLHARIASHLSRGSERPDVVAVHWKVAEHWSEAADSFERAARLAKETWRPVEELAFLDEAAACHQLAGSPAQAWRAHCAAVAVAFAAEGAHALATRIDALQAQAQGPSQWLDVHLARSRARIDASDGPAALQAASAALTLALELADPTRELVAAGWCGLAHALCNRMSEALDLMRPYEARAHATADLRARLDFFGGLGYALHVAGDFAGALAVLNAAADAAENMGSLADAVEQLSSISTCLNSLGRQAEAIAQGERALHLWRRLGEPKSVAGAATLTQLAVHYTSEGRLGEALAMLERAVAFFRELGPPSWQAIAEHRLAGAYLRLGQPARARKALSPLTPDADAGRRATRCLVESRLAHLAGKSPLQALQAAWDTLGGELASNDRFSLLLQLAAHSPAQEALSLSLRVLSEAQATGNKPAAVHAWARAADASRQLGDSAAAAERARKAWAAAQQSPPLDMGQPALCRLIHAAAEAGGDVHTAQAALRHGHAWLVASLAQVPEVFVASFRELNPDHRYLLAAATRVAVN